MLYYNDRLVKMTGIVIDLYRFKVLFAVAYLTYLLTENINSIFTCDLWIIGLFRIVHRLPWLFPNTLTNDKFAKYYIINVPLSLLIHMTLLVRKNEVDPTMCTTNQSLEFAIYLETYLTIAFFVVFMVLASVFQVHYTVTITKIFELNEIPFNKITEWNQTDRMCCICYDVFNENDVLAKINCGHHDHLDCMKEWVKKSKTCPRCKGTI